MRHIWIPVWPLFQGVLITAAVFGVSVWEVVEWAWPGALFAAVAGVAVVASLVKSVPVAGDPRDLTALWPLAGVAVLSLLVPLPLAVAAVYLAYVVIDKVGRDQLAASSKYTLNPRNLIITLFSSLRPVHKRERTRRPAGPGPGPLLRPRRLLDTLRRGFSHRRGVHLRQPRLSALSYPRTCLGLRGGFSA
jgi:hypothetical protein